MNQRMGGAVFLWASAVACGGEGDERECVPGDAARSDVVCSAAGEWVPRQDTETVRPRDTSLCPALPPGAYVLRKTLASGLLTCPVLADELLVIQSDGEAVTQMSTAGISCSEVTTVDGCSTTLKRSCTSNGCSVDAFSVIDGQTWTGITSFTALCDDGSGAACTYDLWLESR